MNKSGYSAYYDTEIVCKQFRYHKKTGNVYEKEFFSENTPVGLELQESGTEPNHIPDRQKYKGTGYYSGGI